MSQDWKRKLAEQNARKAEQERREAVQNEEEARERERSQRYERLSRIKCHICGTRGTGPATYDNGDNIGDSTHYIWSRPENLDKCGHCGRWACDEHMTTYYPKKAPWGVKAAGTRSDGTVIVYICEECAN